MIVDTREVRNVSQYARMLEFVCTVMQLCGGFEPDVLLQPQVTTCCALLPHTSTLHAALMHLQFPVVIYDDILDDFSTLFYYIYIYIYIRINL